ncbi:MAG: hypothetical protein J6W36_08080 [Clostridiales bacterium]|nr:hypothetical protein [Clostridiales bacterium]
MSWDELTIILLAGILFLAAIDIFTVILGTVIIAKHKKRAVWFGAGMILTGLYSLSCFLPRYAMALFTFPVEIYTVISEVSYIFAFGSIFTFFLYARQNYGSGKILLFIIFFIASYIPSWIMFSLFKGGIISAADPFARIISLLNSLGLIASLIYTAIIYCRNKEKEKTAHKLWILFLIFEILFALNFIFNPEFGLWSHISCGLLCGTGFYMLSALKKEKKAVEQ